MGMYMNSGFVYLQYSKMIINTYTFYGGSKKKKTITKLQTSEKYRQYLFVLN